MYCLRAIANTKLFLLHISFCNLVLPNKRKINSQYCFSSVHIQDHVALKANASAVRKIS